MGLKLSVETDTKEVGTDIYKMSQNSIYYSLTSPKSDGWRSTSNLLDLQFHP